MIYLINEWIGRRKKIELRYILIGVISVLLLWFARFSLNHSAIEIEQPHFLFTHTLLEGFSIFVSYSIFIQSIVTYSSLTKNSNFFLGVIFLAVGTFDLFHTLFYRGMPYLNDEFSVTRATSFWVLARLVESIGVLLAILLTKRLWIRKIKTVVGIVVIGIIVLSAIVITFPDKLPILFVEGSGMTNLKVRLEYFICFIIMLTLIILIKRYVKKPNIITLYLIAGVFLMLVGELYFTIYSKVFDIENLIGHVYKFLGYFYLYRAIYFPRIQQIVIGKKEAEIKRKEAEYMLFEVEKNLSRLVFQAHEEERKRVSRELHDGIGQSLYSILMTLNIVDKELEVGNQSNSLQKAKKMTADAMIEVKGIAHSLRPSSLDDLGFLPAIKTYTESYGEMNGIQMNLKLIGDGDRDRLDSEIETALYRICQESLTNIAKYAEADHVNLSIENCDLGITLTVQDNGVGFCLEQYLEDVTRQGIGLFSMKERAELVGGTFTINSEPGFGTTIIIQIPKSKTM